MDASRNGRLNVMRAQLARSFSEFQQVVGGEGDPRREELRTQLQLDFAFIAAYWLVFATLSGLLAARDFSAAVWLGAIAGEVATIAALLDVTENVQTLRVLRVDAAAGGQPEALVRTMRSASLAKWSFVFAAGALISPLFLHEHSWWHKAVGCGYVLAAAGGLIAVILELTLGRTAANPRPLNNALRAAFFLLAISQLVGVPVAAASS